MIIGGSVTLNLSGVSLGPPPVVPVAPVMGNVSYSINNTGNANTFANVTFTPSCNGGLPVQSYRVASNTGISATGVGTTITVNGLTKGNAYTFTATATNAQGTGQASNISATIVPVTVPGAPTAGASSQVPGCATANVNYTAPTDTGGNVIIKYTAVSCPGNVTANVSQSGSGLITVSGLNNKTTYTFKVYATNSMGTGLLSNTSGSTYICLPTGSQFYTTAGTYTWVVPSGVKSISVVAVGGGGGGGNNSASDYGGGGSDSYFCSTSVVKGGGGTIGGYSNGCGGSFTGDGGSNGTTAGAVQCAGGAGGYGSGGGGGKGTSFGGGGGVGLFGQGSTGASGTTGGGGSGGGAGGAGNANYAGSGGGGASYVCGVGGSGGGPGGSVGCVTYPYPCFHSYFTQSGGGNGGPWGSMHSGNYPSGGGGGAFGGGGGGANAIGGGGGGLGYKNNITVTAGSSFTVVVGQGGRGAEVNTQNAGGSGAAGAVRIVWPGNSRQFPSTNVSTP